MVSRDGEPSSAHAAVVRDDAVQDMFKTGSGLFMRELTLMGSET